MILTVSIQGCGAHPEARHASSAPPAPSLPWFRALTRTAERGSLDAILLDGQWGPGAPYVLDPMPLVAALAECSTRIGLGGAIALNHAEPFNIARTFAAVDRLTAGRSAWIAITGTARPGDYGHAPARTVEERQARAAECIAVVRKLWDSWEDEAILLDKPGGRFSNPDRVHRIEHAGPFFSVRGPLNAPRPLQGNPPVFQRDASPEGLALARQTADVFAASVADPSTLAAIRRALGDGPRLLATIVPLLAPTQAEADARAAALGGTTTGLSFVGTPEGLAARLAELSPLCDGFDIAPAVLPLDLDLFVDETVPRLRALGLRPATYEGLTLREHLRLPRPRSQFAA
ncbi:MAG: LLM class flavin-dependent oxidoreductase [Alphaproteobacteria bacterium]|nr:LLM class flavin-dependent oxidoreductase [Alphaproteobacteria bacterium]